MAQKHVQEKLRSAHSTPRISYIYLFTTTLSVPVARIPENVSEKKRFNPCVNPCETFQRLEAMYGTHEGVRKKKESQKVSVAIIHRYIHTASLPIKKHANKSRPSLLRVIAREKTPPYVLPPPLGSFTA